MLEKAAEGDLDTEIEEKTYLETKKISGAVSRTIRKLKAVDKSRQEFVSNVSHELKTPYYFHTGAGGFPDEHGRCAGRAVSGIYAGHFRMRLTGKAKL